MCSDMRNLGIVQSIGRTRKQASTGGTHKNDILIFDKQREEQKALLCSKMFGYGHDVCNE